MKGSTAEPQIVRESDVKMVGPGYDDDGGRDRQRVDPPRPRCQARHAVRRGAWDAKQGAPISRQSSHLLVEALVVG